MSVLKWLAKKVSTKAPKEPSEAGQKSVPEDSKASESESSTPESGELSALPLSAESIATQEEIPEPGQQEPTEQDDNQITEEESVVEVALLQSSEAEDAGTSPTQDEIQEAGEQQPTHEQPTEAAEPEPSEPDEGAQVTGLPDHNEVVEEFEREPESRIRILTERELAPEESANVTAEDQPQELATFLGVNQGLRLFCGNEEKRRRNDCDIVFRQSVYQAITHHVGEDVTREHGGLLLGFEEFYVVGRPPTVWITDALPAQHTQGTLVRLTFTEETWAEFSRQTELRPNLRRVGWYHSHPNHGVFLSNYDLNVCADFTRPTQVALVVDPIRHEGGFFVRGDDGYRSHSPQGFYEMQDLQANSMVSWKNVRQIDNNQGQLSVVAPEMEVSVQTNDSRPTSETLGEQPNDFDKPEDSIKLHEGHAAGIRTSDQWFSDRGRQRMASDGFQPIKLKTTMPVNTRSGVPPWAFLLVGVLLPTLLALLGLRSLTNLDEKIDRLERSLSGPAGSQPSETVDANVEANTNAKTPGPSPALGDAATSPPANINSTTLEPSPSPGNAASNQAANTPASPIGANTGATGNRQRRKNTRAEPQRSAPPARKQSVLKAPPKPAGTTTPASRTGGGAVTTSTPSKPTP